MAQQQGGGGASKKYGSSLGKSPDHFAGVPNLWADLEKLVLSGSKSGAYAAAAPGKNYNPTPTSGKAPDYARSGYNPGPGNNFGGSTGGGGGGDASAIIEMMLSGADMASKEYAPLFDLLNKQRGQAEQRYTKAGNEVGGMYDALSKDIRGDEQGIKGNYGAAGSAIGSAYNQAIGSTKESFGDTRNDISAIARRLGVQQAVPSALAGAGEQENRLVGLMNAQSANFQGVNQLLGNNEVDYNRETANTARFAGNNARADFKGRLMEALAGLDNKELELQGDQQGAANKYDLSIKEMQQDAELARQKMAQDAQGNEFKQAGLMLEQGRLDLDNDKFLASREPKPADTKNMGAYEALSTLAKRLYGNDVSAGNASQAIEDTFQRGAPGADKRWTDANEFIQDVMKRNQSAGDYRQLQQLALEFYSRLAGGANKEFGYNNGM